jgi:hypothetical protein
MGTPTNYYAGGGGGGGQGGTSGIGGQGGGANGGANNGTSGRGGGGGGQNVNQSSGSGGSGVVILRIPASKYSGTTTGSPTVTDDGAFKVLTYTGVGSYTA